MRFDSVTSEADALAGLPHELIDVATLHAIHYLPLRTNTYMMGHTTFPQFALTFSEKPEFSLHGFYSSVQFYIDEGKFDTLFFNCEDFYNFHALCPEYRPLPLSYVHEFLLKFDFPGRIYSPFYLNSVRIWGPTYREAITGMSSVNFETTSEGKQLLFSEALYCETCRFKHRVKQNFETADPIFYNDCVNVFGFSTLPLCRQLDWTYEMPSFFMTQVDLERYLQFNGDSWSDYYHDVSRFIRMSIFHTVVEPHSATVLSLLDCTVPGWNQNLDLDGIPIRFQDLLILSGRSCNIEMVLSCYFSYYITDEQRERLRRNFKKCSTRQLAAMLLRYPFPIIEGYIFGFLGVHPNLHHLVKRVVCLMGNRLLYLNKPLEFLNELKCFERGEKPLRQKLCELITSYEPIVAGLSDVPFPSIHDQPFKASGFPAHETNIKPDPTAARPRVCYVIENQYRNNSSTNSHFAAANQAFEESHHALQLGIPSNNTDRPQYPDFAHDRENEDPEHWQNQMEDDFLDADEPLIVEDDLEDDEFFEGIDEVRLENQIDDVDLYKQWRKSNGLLNYESMQTSFKNKELKISYMYNILRDIERNFRDHTLIGKKIGQYFYELHRNRVGPAPNMKAFLYPSSVPRKMRHQPQNLEEGNFENQGITSFFSNINQSVKNLGSVSQNLNDITTGLRDFIESTRDKLTSHGEALGGNMFTEIVRFVSFVYQLVTSPVRTIPLLVMSTYPQILSYICQNIKSLTSSVSQMRAKFFSPKEREGFGVPDEDSEDGRFQTQGADGMDPSTTDDVLSSFVTIIIQNVMGIAEFPHKRIANLSNLIKNSTTITEFAQKMCVKATSVYRRWRCEVEGKVYVPPGMSGEVIEIIETWALLVRQNVFVTCNSDIAVAKRLKDLQDKVQISMTKYIGYSKCANPNDPGRVAFIALLRIRTEIEKCFRDMRVTMKSNVFKRKPPLSIHIHGKAGIGKTKLVDVISKYLHVKTGGTHSVDTTTYRRFPTEEFWDDYCGQRFVVMHDPLCSTEILSNQRYYADVMKMVDSAPYTVNMAVAELKGNVPMVSEFLIITSNVSPRTPSLSNCQVDPEAFLRRLHVKVHIQLEDKYKLASGKIDPTLIEAARPEEGEWCGFPDDAFIFKVDDLEIRSLKVFLAHCLQKHKENSDTEGRLNEAISSWVVQMHSDDESSDKSNPTAQPSAAVSLPEIYQSCASLHPETTDSVIHTLEATTSSTSAKVNILNITHPFLELSGDVHDMNSQEMILRVQEIRPDSTTKERLLQCYPHENGPKPLEGVQGPRLFPIPEKYIGRYPEYVYENIVESDFDVPRNWFSTHYYVDRRAYKLIDKKFPVVKTSKRLRAICRCTATHYLRRTFAVDGFSFAEALKFQCSHHHDAYCERVSTSHFETKSQNEIFIDMVDEMRELMYEQAEEERKAQLSWTQKIKEKFCKLVSDVEAAWNTPIYKFVRAMLKVLGSIVFWALLFAFLNRMIKKGAEKVVGLACDRLEKKKDPESLPEEELATQGKQSSGVTAGEAMKHHRTNKALTGVHLRRANMSSQNMESQAFDMTDPIVRNVNRNACSLVFQILVGDEIQRAKIFGFSPGKDFIIFPSHVLLRHDGELLSVDVCFLNGSTVRYMAEQIECFRLSRDHIWRTTDSFTDEDPNVVDVAALRLPGKFNRAIISQHFIPRNEKRTIVRVGAIGLRSTMPTLHSGIVQSMTLTKRTFDVPNTNRHTYGYEGYIIDGLGFSNGDCGILVEHDCSSINGKYIGFHVAGKGNLAYVIKVPREDIEDLLSISDEPVLSVQDGFEPFEPDRLADEEKLPRLHFIGKVPIEKAVAMPRRNKLHPSPLADKIKDNFGAASTAPSIVFEPSYGVFHTALAKQGNSTGGFDTDLMLRIREEMKKEYHSLSDKMPLRLLEEDEILNGIPPSYGPIDTKTSPGYPYVLRKDQFPGKKNGYNTMTS
jgi:hypothetical protein